MKVGFRPSSDIREGASGLAEIAQAADQQHHNRRDGEWA
jgi:hypothetical protein